ncbi:MAG: PH domain-containing protein [Fervidobacterium sp.]|nr:PH domain-containing protein [Fervidobacterium sp.]HPT54887.1 PH domain-containing protein [Fervidobacterium sp.]HPZ18636.1 PH domain-containing protein [Fervidobacterium sp.]HQE49824.1 PH domain-containing protein [Fervidobacterium sp.]
MKCIATDSHLLLQCGSQRKDIPYSEIEKITIKDLRVTPLVVQAEGLIKFPGYALGKI